MKTIKSYTKCCNGFVPGQFHPVLNEQAFVTAGTGSRHER